VQVAADGAAVPGAAVYLLDGPDAGRRAQADAAGRVLLERLTQAGFTVCSKAEGFTEACAGITLTSSQNVTLTLARLAPPARRGVVRADRHVLTDDGGPFLPVGTTLFWAVWGWAHDRARVEEHLGWLQRQGVDYIRVLATVGGGFWSDRAVDARRPEFEETLGGLIDAAYARGLRVQVTVFGDHAFAATRAERRSVVERVARVAAIRPAAVFAIEVANEGWQTGFGGEAGISEARELARLLQASVPNLVAVTAPQVDDCTTQAAWYLGVGSLVTLHFDRNVSLSDGYWRPVRQPWREAAFRCEGVANAYANNEPIGPGSSVATDDDPLRLSMAAAVSYVAGVGSYLLHTGAGVYGKPHVHPAGGFRPANVWEVARVEEALAGLRAIRAALPPDLPNWEKANGHWDRNPFAADLTALLRNFCGRRDADFVCVPIGIKREVAFRARAAMRVRVLHPLTGAVLQTHDLPAGGSFTLPADPAAAVVIGAFQ
jgi:hypothetical protein